MERAKSVDAVEVPTPASPIPKGHSPIHDGLPLVKLSDNEDNADPRRPLFAGSTLSVRYATSMKRLRAAAEALGYPQRPAAP